MYMQLDVNTDIYPMHAGEKFAMSLASTLDLDGTPDTGYYTQVILFFSWVLISYYLGQSMMNLNINSWWSTLTCFSPLSLSVSLFIGLSLNFDSHSRTLKNFKPNYSSLMIVYISHDSLRPAIVIVLVVIFFF